MANSSVNHSRYLQYVSNQAAQKRAKFKILKQVKTSCMPKQMILYLTALFANKIENQSCYQMVVISSGNDYLGHPRCHYNFADQVINQHSLPGLR